MKNIFLILLSAFFILGCTNTPSITPDKLPKASVGEHYNVKIEIEKVILVDELFVDSNITKDSGLVLNTGIGDPPYSDNIIEVKGVPVKMGEYEIIIEGQTRNAYGRNINFRKKYDLVVLK
ncbi:hypothetical protein [Acinetobacter bereziniae]|uniref:hypothetical protein n=1 Tax=Acinetobacter bereziniae TaxID=106648 RepID=UPI001D0ECA4E|nr:hypothetical protein [Acinetobacter bereziniae]